MTFSAEWFGHGEGNNGLEWQWGTSRTSVPCPEAPLQGVWLRKLPPLERTLEHAVLREDPEPHFSQEAGRKQLFRGEAEGP